MNRYFEPKPPLSDLTHHGVKGMHWGVRRERKRIANANAQRFYNSLSDPSVDQYVIAGISEKEYKSLSSKPVKLGKDFDRVSRSGTTNFRNIAYVSKSPDDRTRYTVLMGGAKGSLAANPMQLKVQTAREAISPSMKTRVDTYIETLGQELPSKNGKTVAKGRDYLKNVNLSVASALNDRELGLATYKVWTQGQHALDTPLYTAYFDNLRKKGYNAVVDDADRGIVSDLPVILFPKESEARVTEIKPITKEDIINAKLDVKPAERR